MASLNKIENIRRQLRLSVSMAALLFLAACGSDANNTQATTADISGLEPVPTLAYLSNTFASPNNCSDVDFGYIRVTQLGEVTSTDADGNKVAVPQVSQTFLNINKEPLDPRVPCVDSDERMIVTDKNRPDGTLSFVIEPYRFIQ